MKPPFPPNSPDIPPFALRVDELRRELAGRHPQELAAKSGASYSSNTSGEAWLQLSLWGEGMLVECKSWQVRRAAGLKAEPLHIQGLLLYYLLTADGAPLAQRWVSFAELPDGRFYQAAFQGYSGEELRRTFGPDIKGFSGACLSSGGYPDEHHEHAFAFQALPRLPLLAVAWPGDEDFPPAYRVLFDESAPHYLPTDVCAILGSFLTRRIIRGRSSSSEIQER